MTNFKVGEKVLYKDKTYFVESIKHRTITIKNQFWRIKIPFNHFSYNLIKKLNHNSELVKVLIRRGDHTLSEIKEMITNARKRFEDGENPEEILHEEFGLKPDYLFDLIEPVPGEFEFEDREEYNDEEYEE